METEAALALYVDGGPVVFRRTCSRMGAGIHASAFELYFVNLVYIKEYSDVK